MDVSPLRKIVVPVTVNEPAAARQQGQLDSLSVSSRPSSTIGASRSQSRSTDHQYPTRKIEVHGKEVWVCGNTPDARKQFREHVWRQWKCLTKRFHFADLDLVRALAVEIIAAEQLERDECLQQLAEE